MPKARSAQPRQAPATRTDGGGGGTSVRRGIAAASLAAPRGPSPLKHPHPKRFQHLTGRRGTHHPCCSVASSPSAPCTPGGATQGAGGTPALRTVQTGPWGAAAIGHAGAAGAREPARSRSGAGGGGRGASWHRKPAHGEGVWERSWDQRGVGKAARGDVCPPGPIGAGRCTRCPIAPPTGETLQVPTGRGRAQHGAARPRSGVVGAQPPPPPGRAFGRQRTTPHPPQPPPALPALGARGGGRAAPPPKLSPEQRAGPPRGTAGTRRPQRSPGKGRERGRRPRSGPRHGPEPPPLLPPPRLAPARGPPGCSPPRLCPPRPAEEWGQAGGRGAGAFVRCRARCEGAAPAPSPAAGAGGGGMGTLADPPSPSPTSLCAAEPAAPWAP